MKLSRQEFIDCLTTHKVAILHRTKGRIETRMQIDDHTFDRELSSLEEHDYYPCQLRSGGIDISCKSYCFLYYPLNGYDINFYRFGNIFVAEEIARAYHLEYHYDVFAIQ